MKTWNVYLKHTLIFIYSVGLLNTTRFIGALYDYSNWYNDHGDALNHICRNNRFQITLMMKTYNTNAWWSITHSIGKEKSM